MGSVIIITLVSLCAPLDEQAEDLFRRDIAPILEGRCLSCHNSKQTKGEFSLETAESTFEGGESGEVIDAGAADDSYLLELITPSRGKAEMPKNSDPLKAEEIALIRKWIEDGAKWPDGHQLEPPKIADTDWWSLRPLSSPEIPKVSANHKSWARTPIDAFIVAELERQKLRPSIEADRRTLIRRLSYDLTGLPPTPAQIAAFEADKRPNAYEILVDRLLASPGYGERWARHWLDVVHYGDTHGYDKDKLRPFAWPYRDYVIRSFNQDKPYSRFVREQLAGDILYPGTIDGIVALGFISAGPWDFVGHAEVKEDKIDGKIARHLDRDDMVAATMNTFVSTTVQCAQCHNHKFDPVSQEDYYSLHAVFASIDRANRPYDVDPDAAKNRSDLVEHEKRATQQIAVLDQKIKAANPKQRELEQKIAKLVAASTGKARPEFGYHSSIVKRQDVQKWVQVDLGKSIPLQEIEIVGCHDDFNSIGAGFGFPVRFRVELSDNAEFAENNTTIVDHTDADFSNPGMRPLKFDAKGRAGRYIRITANKLAARQNDFIFALAEISAVDIDGKSATAGKKVSARDSIEAPPRWRRANLVDGYYMGVGASSETKNELARLRAQKQRLQASPEVGKLNQQRAKLDAERKNIQAEISKLAKPKMVYAGTVHNGKAPFRGRGGLGPREIRVLHRGDIKTPGDLAVPGTIDIVPNSPARFNLSKDHVEGDRRAALANWIVDQRNPLTWRSIVNRVWLYHFGRGLVNTPNDMGRMGERPSHPQLLDYLATQFREKQSIKDLHRAIVTSSVYRQSSAMRDDATNIDANNKYLWRMNRKRLDAESIRDSVLLLAGKLDRKMYGPGFRDFVLEHPQHSPHYEFTKHNPDDPAIHRRSIYRFLVRSQQQPFMQSLDCADPSQLTDKRGETLTVLQALAMFNNKLVTRMSHHFAEHIQAQKETLPNQVDAAFTNALGRAPTKNEHADLVTYATKHGLANTCRVILNLNEFVFVD